MIQIDMEMPKCCDECFALDDHGDYPFCLISQDQRGYTFNTKEKRMPTCPLKAQESPTSESISSAIECLLHPQDADDSDMAKAIDTAVRAMRMLKTQESRLVTEADFENADPYGYLPVWVEDKDDSEIICDCITKYAITKPDENYHYRFWTSRPTDEQREKVKWG